ncbi:wall-associated receptor kinase-like 1 isoform X2 [Tripterygium wilfordii]|uniref:wall-associated receptor kinase-like 1 isoform X2 n=1 Tax=Tripterygium wilfordii TaxID=458696 RepID=UPI0018F7FB22|nr:wall-associated receptor kinase-like 1 isoform X2 [Tripterygium wilfordii]
MQHKKHQPCKQAPPPPLAKPGCSTQCGDVEIPFPFGVGAGCSIDEWYAIECRNGSKPFIKGIGLEVLGISLEEGTMLVNHPIFSDCDIDDNEDPEKRSYPSTDLEGSPFQFNQMKNRFTGVGSNNAAFMTIDQEPIAGCMSQCDKDESEEVGCFGINCCQTRIPRHLKVFNATMVSMSESCKRGCRYSFLVQQNWFQTYMNNRMRIISYTTEVPVTLDWGVYYQSFGLYESSKSKAYNFTSKCGNSDQFRSSLSIIQCSCRQGYVGNPYLLKGCQDVDECNQQPPNIDVCPSSMICENLPGTYKCSGYNVPRVPRKSVILTGIGGGLGLVFALLGAWWLHKALKKRKEQQLKEKNFKQNGGLLLRQQLSSIEVNVDKIKIFNSKELAKATDNFNMARMLGRGGQGTVYKGMLRDGRIVAVKKSKIVDERKIREFINEVVILSQISHRNVVKLWGCCLETEVPLLVYEFIPNGTLYEYLHTPNDEFPFTWEMRLRIAMEVAGALTYLHLTAASFPIYHRDIKSSNILLDDKYRAKIADFGTSKSFSPDKTHVTTRVQGTFGYLDPEYFQSSQFTEKSDVYSFGVVLVELLTGKKPISRISEESLSLVTLFLSSMEEDTLSDIMDAQVLNSHHVKEEMAAVAQLAKKCVNLNGKQRPTMKEVTQDLESIRQWQTGSCVPLHYDEEFRDIGSETSKSWEEDSTSRRSSSDDSVYSSWNVKPFSYTM